MSGENYHPEYVAMRNLGRNNRPLIGQHDWTGSTSANEMGFDPLVVPTLIDNLKKKVIADSKTIMDYLDQEHSAINFSNYVPYFENGKIWLVEIANFVCSRVISYWVGTS